MCLDVENVNGYNTSKVSRLKRIDSLKECSDKDRTIQYSTKIDNETIQIQ